MNKQTIILNYLKEVKQATLQEIIDNTGFYYYCNAKKHYGSIMKNLINSGKVRRIRNGVFTIATPKATENLFNKKGEK